MLPTLLLIFGALYVLQILAFAVAAWFNRSPSDPAIRPSVCIVIAARNEEENIGKCLDSLLKLTYPRELLEIVIVDDRSTDATRDIVRRYAAQHPHVTLMVAAPGRGQMQGKTNAVTQGIEATHGDVILFTDADCEVPPGWVEQTVGYYTDERIGIVAGFTVLRGRGWFAAMQAFDWFFLFSVAAAVIKLHFPVTAVGNNLSVRRKAYDDTGGYRKIPFSVTEDYALFHAVTSKARYRACFPMEPAALVRSQACETVRSLHRQKLRWFTGGRDMDLKSILIFSISYVLNILLCVSIFTSPTDALSVFLSKSAADLLLMLPTLGRFRQWRLLPVFPLFELYYTLYVLLYPVLVLFGQKVVWKERAFGD